MTTILRTRSRNFISSLSWTLPPFPNLKGHWWFAFQRNEQVAFAVLVGLPAVLGSFGHRRLLVWWEPVARGAPTRRRRPAFLRTVTP